MTSLVPTSELVAYDDDHQAWVLQQVLLLKTGRLAGIDIEHLVEELNALAGSNEQEIESRLMVLLQHLLKWEFQPEGRSNSWRASIREQRHRIGRLIERSPSLRRYPATVLADEYQLSRLWAADDTGLPLTVFPQTCPYSAQDALSADFWPGGVGHGDE